jgi:hypothetical protein
MPWSVDLLLDPVVFYVVEVHVDVKPWSDSPDSKMEPKRKRKRKRKDRIGGATIVASRS